MVRLWGINAPGANKGEMRFNAKAQGMQKTHRRNDGKTFDETLCAFTPYLCVESLIALA
jgi:hypothetical protein